MRLSVKTFGISNLLVLIFFVILILNCGDTSGPGRAPSPDWSNLAITEIQYNPYADSTDKGSYEFIEIKNKGSSSCDLSDVVVTGGIEYAFAKGTSVNANGFIVLASDSQDFKKRYGFYPNGVYTKGLGNSGDTIILKDAVTDKPFLTVVYSDGYAWPKQADGKGYSLVPQTADLSGDPNDPSYWRASFEMYGSPGKDDPKIVYINEALTHTDPPQADAIELYNPNKDDVDIGGWYLSDRKDVPKYRIPDHTIIKAKDYIVFYDTSSFDNPNLPESKRFRVSSHGEDIFLLVDSLGTEYTQVKVGEMINGVSFGRYITSEGDIHFVAQKKLTLGAENAGPNVGPVVISRIMYHPVDSTGEYVELVNISGGPVKLYWENDQYDTWKIEGIKFHFPPGITLEAGDTAYIATDSLSVEDFRKKYNIGSNIQVFSASKSLSNSGEDLCLMGTTEPYIDSSKSVVDTVKPLMLIDEVKYRDSAPWPAEADGKGASLERIDLHAYGDDPANWKAGNAAP